jgi:hypothetical protein
MAEAYESPVVVSFGELDFEPADLIVCSTLVSCTGEVGSCTSIVTIDN